jgi:hypothetical protein
MYFCGIESQSRIPAGTVDHIDNNHCRGYARGPSARCQPELSPADKKDAGSRQADYD